MSETRIGFVGAGYMGQLAHLRNYDRVDDCEVVALAEPRTELTARVARRYEIPETYSDHEELLAEANVDAVVAAQPYQRQQVHRPGYPRGRAAAVQREAPRSQPRDGSRAGRRRR